MNNTAVAVPTVYIVYDAHDDGIGHLPGVRDDYIYTQFSFSALMDQALPIWQQHQGFAEDPMPSLNPERDIFYIQTQELVDWAGGWGIFLNREDAEDFAISRGLNNPPEEEGEFEGSVGDLESNGSTIEIINSRLSDNLYNETNAEVDLGFGIYDEEGSIRTITPVANSDDDFEGDDFDSSFVEEFINLIDNVRYGTYDENGDDVFPNLAT
jgi:hypothetical protein